MLTVNFADVYISPSKFHHDTDVIAYVEKHNECQRTLAWWTQHDDGDEFMYMDLLFCEDIQTIFITDYYGYNFHSFDEEVEYCPELYQQQPETHEYIREIKAILKQMYPSYTTHLYNKGLYKHIQDTTIQQTWSKLEATGMDMIPDIEEKMFQLVAPMWCRFYKKTHRHRWDIYQASRNSFEDAMNLFYYQWDNLKALVETRTNYLGILSHVVHRP